MWKSLAALGFVAACGSHSGRMNAQDTTALHEPVLVMTASVKHSLDSLWHVADSTRQEQAACFPQGTYQVVHTPQLTWAVVAGDIAAPRGIVHADSLTIETQYGENACDPYAVGVHTHIVDTKPNFSFRYGPSEIDIRTALKHPALFSILVASPDSIYVYGAKASAMW